MRILIGLGQMMGRVGYASRAGLLGLVGLVCLPAAVSAQDLLGEYTDWRAWRYEENGGLMCFMMSEAQQRVAGPSGDAGRIYVTHRTWHDEVGIVSVNPGVPLQDEERFAAQIGNNEFGMESFGTSQAWPYQGRESDLVNAMISGIELRFTGQTSSGDTITDVFSLRGFTAAYREISRACNVN